MRADTAFEAVLVAPASHQVCAVYTGLRGFPQYGADKARALILDKIPLILRILPVYIAACRRR